MSVKLREIFKLNAAAPGKTWFDAQMLADGRAQVDIRGVIGDWEVDPQMLVDRLAAIDAEKPSEVVLRIDSPGGTVSGGVSIMTAITQMNSRVVAEIWGSCYSMATMVAMAADEVRIAKDADMMIHNPKGLAFGTATEIRAALQYLDNVRAQAIDRYTAKVEKAGHTREEVDAAMTDAGTYYTSLQAVEFGLADLVMEDKRDTQRMCIDREFAAVMLADAPEEVEIPLAPEATDEFVVEAPAPEAPIVVETPAVVEPVQAPAATDAKMLADADPVVAAMKSDADSAPVMTARPAEAAQPKPANEAAPWAMRIAEMNRNFGQF